MGIYILNRMLSLYKFFEGMWVDIYIYINIFTFPLITFINIFIIIITSLLHLVRDLDMNELRFGNVYIYIYLHTLLYT